MAIEQGPMSGFRDLLAEQMIPRDETIDSIKKVYETYGFVPLKTPALERHSTLTGKYGDEGEGLMYAFEDNGKRKVAMRYDHTVPLARVVAQYGGILPQPYKRYTIGDVWRGESPQAGRYREFAQFDADIIGADSYLADAEIIAMMSDTMKEIGVEALVRVNDRHILDGLSQICGADTKEKFSRFVGAIDKIDKIGMEAVVQEIAKLNGDHAAEIVKQFLTLDGNSEEKIDSIERLIDNDEAKKGVLNLRNIMEVLRYSGYTEDSIAFDQTIARGLTYYTGTIYETTLKDMPQIGSVCSGGRYDSLIGQLGGPDTPAVGTSIGVDRLIEALRQLGQLRNTQTKTRLYITNVDEGLDKQRFALAQQLRSTGIATEIIYESGRKLGKQIKLIDKLGVSRIVILGNRENDNGCVTIKNLDSGEQKEVTSDQVADMIEDM